MLRVWQVRPETVVMLGADTSVAVWHAETRGTITMEIIIIVTIETMVTTIILNIGLHIDTQTGCVLFMTTSRPGPNILQVV